MIELFSNHLILGLILLGTTLCITVGAIPGLTGTMLIALSLPLTFSMEPVAGLVLLVGMYVGAVSGGLISATLLRMPGTPAAIMTTLDGYPMASSGRPGRALGLVAVTAVCTALRYLAVAVRVPVGSPGSNSHLCGGGYPPFRQRRETGLSGAPGALATEHSRFWG